MVKILLVEDNLGDARLFRAMLKEGAGDAEFSCEHVDRLSLALEKLREDAFDIVMLDLSLPDSQGPETFVSIRAQFPYLPIVLLTGLNDQELGLKAMKEGVQDYLVKGQLDADGLMRSIRYSIERNQTEKALASSSKMAALGTMAGGVAHEVNTPLTMILLQISSVRDAINTSTPDKEAITRQLDSIEKSVNRVSKIMSGLRTFTSEVKMDAPVQASLKTIFEEALADCKTCIERSGALVSKDIPGALKLTCRPSQISKALAYLIHNSCEAVAQLSDRWIQIQAAEHDTYIELSVTDSGTGIAAEIIDKLYDPFFTTKGRSQNAGLGLSVSRGIITGDGGSLFLDKESPHTRFVVQLPKGSG